jgi:hypothetical protein
MSREGAVSKTRLAEKELFLVSIYAHVQGRRWAETELMLQLQTIQNLELN